MKLVNMCQGSNERMLPKKYTAVEHQSGSLSGKGRDIHTSVCNKNAKQHDAKCTVALFAGCNGAHDCTE
jgi:hypothetical protein